MVLRLLKPGSGSMCRNGSIGNCTSSVAHVELRWGANLHMSHDFYQAFSCSGSSDGIHLPHGVCLSHPAVGAQFEFGGGCPLASATSDRWCNPKLLRKPSAEQSGRELQAMEWRYWNTRAVGGMQGEISEMNDIFCFEIFIHFWN